MLGGLCWQRRAEPGALEGFAGGGGGRGLSLVASSLGWGVGGLGEGLPVGQARAGGVWKA